MPTYLNNVCAQQYGNDNDARVQWYFNIYIYINCVLLGIYFKGVMEDLHFKIHLVKQHWYIYRKM